MVSLNDIKDLTLYKKQFYLPIDLNNKKNGAAITLLTPNFQSSMIAMTAPFTVNHRYYESYYVEKAITKLIQNESVINMEDSGEYIFEKALTSDQKKNLPDDCFGIPELKKYPMPDKEHVLLAIKFFNHVEEKYEKELASNIIKRIEHFKMESEIHVGDKNRFKKYWDKYLSSHKSSINEFVNRTAVDRANKKLGNVPVIVFNGFEKDIKSVKSHIKVSDITTCFSRIKLEAPDQIEIIVCPDHTVNEEFTDTSVLIYTPEAMKKSSWELNYTDYIKYILQLYAIYTIKVVEHNVTSRVYNGKVMDSLAESAAILLSGVAANKMYKPNMKDKFVTERTMDYIVKRYGIDTLLDILRRNDIKAIFKYNKEINEGTLTVDEGLKLIREEYDFITEEDIPVATSMPESLKKLQTMGTRLKRRIKQHSAYKLNKIARDINTGNIGAETNETNSLEALKSGNVASTNTPQVSSDTVEESYSLYKFNTMTNKDYITEGNVVYLFEDSNNYDAQLRKALFMDRLKSNKQVLDVYKRVKSTLPFIKYTYLTIPQYKGRNLFIDLSYYNEVFFRNMDSLNEEDKTNPIRIFNIYIELLKRLIESSNIRSYSQNTVFIPILDWRHNNSMRIWIYREDINPISAIYHMMINEPNKLKSLFGDRDVVFMGAKNYFKINFSKNTFGRGLNTNKFVSLINRIIKLGYNSPADPDPEGEFDSSPKGIAMDIINRIEKSTNVSIDNVSKFSSLGTSTDITNSIDSGDNLSNKMAVKKSVVDYPAGSNVEDKTDVVNYGKMTAVDTSKNVKGKNVIVGVDVQKKNISSADNKADTSMDNNNAVNKTTEEDRKNAIVDMVSKVANSSDSVDTAMDKLSTEEFKEMILAIQNDSSKNVRVTATQASSVIAAQNEFHKKEVAGKSVEDLLKEDVSKEKLPETKLKVASINDDWNNMTFMNFDKDYDPDSDIVKMLDSMQHWTFPVAVRNIDVRDNSTSEDVLDLWTIDCVDFKGTKFTIKVDVPKFINGSNFLKLRGNEKTLMIQSTMLPIIKTGLDECQIIGSGGYNKIFVRRYGARKGQSMPAANKLLRTLPKYASTHDDIKIITGDNTKVCKKYELPIDYIDLAQTFNTVELNGLKIYFNQDELRSEYVVDDTKGLPVGVIDIYDQDSKKGVKTILYYTANSGYSTVASFISDYIRSRSTEFDAYYSKFLMNNTKYTYSKASILNSKIPIVIVCAYLEGLIIVMKKAGIEYEFVQDLDRSVKYDENRDYIEFSDGYLVYKVTYSSSMLMNALKENDTESYSIRDVNNKRMYIEFLDNYTSMINTDGLENSYDCMLDPITKEILARFKLPTDYVSVLIYASNLLADNKYTKHIDQAGRRWRRKELIAGYFYKALSTSYQEYANSCRHSRKVCKMTMKQSAIIDLFVSKDPATSDLSVNNALNDVECTNSVTNKGLVGMNVTRGYTISTRGYDDSMLNLLGMDTGFSGNVGINRQATLNANIEGGRGFVKTIGGDTSQLSAASSFTITEAVTPLGSTHDDPPRTLMTYVQTSKHMIRCDTNDPTLITTGADEAMPYLTSDIFAYKAKKDGKIIELVQEGFGKKNYMVLEYDDGTHEFVNLSDETKKNSDGGYYVSMKLDTDMREGEKFKAGEIVAYDKLSFSKSLGESGNLAANIGTLAKVAIINTDEAFEDSAAVTESFANKMGTYVVQEISTKLDKGVNIFVYKDIGDSVMEGDTLFDYQSDFDDDVVNTLLKNLTIDTDQISELGRTPVKCKYTGIVSDIVIYRTCDDDSMSESLKAFVDKYENKVRDIKDIYTKYGIDSSSLPKTGKVPEIGRTKALEDAVLVLYYIKYNDRVSVGDKIVFYSANKGTIKYIIPKADEPYTSFRPNEKIDSFMSLSSISGRMTCSIPIFAATSKLMVELDRSIKDLAGIPYDESKL